MAKIIISVDNTADYMKDFMQKNGIYCIPVKRIQNDEVHTDIFNGDSEFEAFYEQIKKGALPTTSQTNPDEFIEYFNNILANEQSGDIIHITLSGGLSGTYNSAVAAANAVNEKQNGRKVYVVDSLLVNGAIQLMANKLLEIRDKTDADMAVEAITDIRDHTQGHFMVDDLFHLHRGGRVSRAKAIIGSILGVKPMLTVDNVGKLSVVGKVKGGKRGIEYLMNLLREHDVDKTEYAGQDIFCVRTTQSDTFRELVDTVKKTYPKAKVTEQCLGTVIASHVGAGMVAIIFRGKSRFEEKPKA